ncbi:uncharacterized protein [Coffea arabica]|uniref:Uncharacterized protein isoform X1 n=1 Tax=Coffea arabica TaxID=13443 RepID=A0A6P6TMA4_COFAR|nr:uncharacterized protein LOC113702247 isoform X1 [Coffea arabica]
MSQPEPVNILSDDDDEDDVVAKTGNAKYNRTAPRSENDVVCIDLSTPSPYFPTKKKQRLSDRWANSKPSSSNSTAPLFILDDDVTPQKHPPGTTPTQPVVTETPPNFSHFFSSKLEEASIRKCSYDSFGLNSPPSVVGETPFSDKVSNSELANGGFSSGNYSSQLLAATADAAGALFSVYSPPGLNSPPSVVDETPILEKVSNSELAITEFKRVDSNFQQLAAAADAPGALFSDCSPPESRLICLQSDNESERGLEADERTGLIVDVAEEFELSSGFVESTLSYGKANQTHLAVVSSPRPCSLEYDLSLVHGTFGDECDRKELMVQVPEPKGKIKSKAISEKGSDNSIRKGRMLKEARLLLKEERKQQKEQEKLEKESQKAEAAELVKLQNEKQKIYLEEEKLEREAQKVEASESVKLQKEKQKICLQKEKLERAAEKAEAAALKKLQKEKQKIYRQQQKLERAAQIAEAAALKKLAKEKQKWEKGKFPQKTIVAQIDSKIVEMGSIGGHLLTRFAEKGLSYRIMSNPIERSIVWTIPVPEQLVQISSEGIVVPYVLLVYGAEEFCNLVMDGTLMDQVSRVQYHYPNHTICYLTNRLMAYINKREQDHYKNPSKYEGWKRPPIEEVLAKLATHFTRVHSRLCCDEAELAEHVVGLTHSLASCQYRKKPTPLSVNANGSLVPKDCADRNLIKKNTWLKALVAIPKVQPRFAIAIWKKYPTMKSLLTVYMDPSKSVHEKEFLLQDLTTEGLLGDDRRLGEICSKRIYRVLMAQCGNVITDDVEHGADFFSFTSPLCC